MVLVLVKKVWLVLVVLQLVLAAQLPCLLQRLTRRRRRRRRRRRSMRRVIQLPPGKVARTGTATVRHTR